MGFEHTWRWFGPHDPITLQEVKQTGATGVVTALHHIPVGEVWTADEIQKRKTMIEKEGLTWSVAESVPVHEAIKKGEGGRYIENYKESIRNLGRSGVDILCYNFMPVLDWSRTDLRVELSDGSVTTMFEARALAAFDLFVLERRSAQKDYSAEEIGDAQEFFDHLSRSQREDLTNAILLGFPGSLEFYTPERLREALREYEGITDAQLRENLYAFLREIVPVAEEAGVLLGIHPDDPPRPLLGLPRVVSSALDIELLLSVNTSTSNGLTLCTGSLGAGVQNDLVAITYQFAHRVNFIHLRNVRKNERGDFVEGSHLSGDVDMFSVMKTLLIEQKRRKDEGRKDFRLPLRPDHGHLMTPDRHWQNVYPGYSLFGRMRGLAELRGLELGISRSLEDN